MQEFLAASDSDQVSLEIVIIAYKFLLYTDQLYTPCTACILAIRYREPYQTDVF